MKFNLLKQLNKIRLGQIKIGRLKVLTPVFMPCATSGAVKGISFEELKNLGFNLILNNTYHLYLRPGEKQIKKLGGTHRFMNWGGGVLTDSGGFQVFSLGSGYKTGDPSTSLRMTTLAKVVKRGVWFRSHLDGSKHLFTPEKVIDIQLDLGSDIIMPLDYCPSADASYEEIEKAVDITNIWFKRAWEHFQKKTEKMNLSAGGRPALFAIVQGGAEPDLRKKSFNYLSQFPVQGFAIGGVANGGESKLKQQRAVEAVIDLLPKDKPRYLMGVGEPEDLIFATKAGVDMFDCVLPTRLGRHGTCWITQNWQKFSKIDLRKSKYQGDKSLIMPNCQCPTCSQGYSRAYLSHLIRAGEMLGMRLASIHNLWILAELTRKIKSGKID